MSSRAELVCSSWVHPSNSAALVKMLELSSWSYFYISYSIVLFSGATAENQYEKSVTNVTKMIGMELMPVVYGKRVTKLCLAAIIQAMDNSLSG